MAKSLPPEERNFIDLLIKELEAEIVNPGNPSAKESFTVSREVFEQLTVDCEVKDLPPNVRCIVCGQVHGS